MKRQWKKLWEKITVLTMAAVMAGSVPGVPLAAAPTSAVSRAVAEVTVVGTGITQYDNIVDAWNAAKSGRSATLRLLTDVSDGGASCELSEGKVTLDLNGYEWEHAAPASGAKDAIAVSGKNASLTVEDGSAGKTGVMKYTDNGSGVSGACLGALDGASVTIAGGSFFSAQGPALHAANADLQIQGGTFSSSGTAIRVESGSFRMSGGEVKSGSLSLSNQNGSLSASLSGGSFARITSEAGSSADSSAQAKSMADILQNGYSFRKTGQSGAWLEGDLSSQYQIEAVEVGKKPVYAVSLTMSQSGPTALAYGSGETISLTASVTQQNGAKGGTYTYNWYYEYENERAKLFGGPDEDKGPSLTRKVYADANLKAGTYRFYVEASYDGGEAVTSEKKTVKVAAAAAADGIPTATTEMRLSQTAGAASAGDGMPAAQADDVVVGFTNIGGGIRLRPSNSLTIPYGTMLFYPGVSEKDVFEAEWESKLTDNQKNFIKWEGKWLTSNRQSISESFSDKLNVDDYWLQMSASYTDYDKKINYTAYTEFKVSIVPRTVLSKELMIVNAVDKFYDTTVSVTDERTTVTFAPTVDGKANPMASKGIEFDAVLYYGDAKELPVSDAGKDLYIWASGIKARGANAKNFDTSGVGKLKSENMVSIDPVQLKVKITASNPSPKINQDIDFKAEITSKDGQTAVDWLDPEKEQYVQLEVTHRNVTGSDSKPVTMEPDLIPMTRESSGVFAATYHTSVKETVSASVFFASADGNYEESTTATTGDIPVVHSTDTSIAFSENTIKEVIYGSTVSYTVTVSQNKPSDSSASEEKLNGKVNLYISKESDIAKVDLNQDIVVKDVEVKAEQANTPVTVTMEISRSVKILNAGEYHVHAVFTDENSNFSSSSANIGLTVTKKTLAWTGVTGLKATKTEGDDKEATVTGTLGVDGILDNEVKFTPGTLTTSGFERTEVGEQEVSVVGWSFTPENPANYTLPPSPITIKGTVTAKTDNASSGNSSPTGTKSDTAANKNTLTGNEKYKLTVTDKLVVSAALKKTDFSTPEKIQSALIDAILKLNGSTGSTASGSAASGGTAGASAGTAANGSASGTLLQAGYTKENIAVYEVTLQVSTDGGTKWVEATTSNFPASGVKVTLPYPSNTGKTTHDFAVAHMFATDANGKKPGDIETPKTTKTAAGVEFVVTGLSPMALAWKAASTRTGALTFDDAPIVRYSCAAAGSALALMAFAGVKLSRKKKKTPY